MSLATSNRDGGKTSESGHLRAIQKSTKGQVLTGLNVSQHAAGANMSVDVAIGDAIIPRSDATYGHPAWADATYNVAITTADASNPRRDIVVKYIDYGNAVSTAVSNNTNGVVKIAVVAGTPAGSPSDPSSATIQSAVGSGNPYVRLARVRVGAGVTTISNSVIDDLRIMAQGLLQGGWTYDDLYTWVYASATTFTIAGVDVTAQFPVGAKIALYQSGSIKYFAVTGSAFSTNTTITVDGGGTYTLANVPIDKPAFSYVNTPQGFPRGLIGDSLADWTELGRGLLSGVADIISVTSIPAMRYLRIYMNLVFSGDISSNLRFNNDSGANYNQIRDSGTSVSQTFIGTGNSPLHQFSTVDIYNPPTGIKPVIMLTDFYANSAASSPTMDRTLGSWVNTSVPITRIDVINSSTGDFAAGSSLLILGRN